MKKLREIGIPDIEGETPRLIVSYWDDGETMISETHISKYEDAVIVTPEDLPQLVVELRRAHLNNVIKEIS